MYQLWDEQKKFPEFGEMKDIEGLKHIKVHEAIEGEYQFLLGAAIIKYQGTLYSSWGNSWRGENDDNTILAEKCSKDGGFTWEQYRRISVKEPGFGRSHGVYCEHEGKLYAFCPKARYDRIDAYPDLTMEGYVMDADGEYECLGIVLEADFWPMCEPIRLEDGSLVMAGLKTNGGKNAEGAVALCDGKDITKWEMRVFPNPRGFRYWGETTVVKWEDKLVAIVRSGSRTTTALVSISKDQGQTWSDLEESNLPIAHSKMYAGVLANGEMYVVFNVRGRGLRDTLAIAVGKDKFDRVYVIRDGFDAPPKYWQTNEWCYPYAYEDREEKKLYVVYAMDKADCEMTVIPTDSLMA